MKRITRLREVLNHFDEYVGATSDDLDGIDITVGDTTYSEEGKHVYELLEKMLHTMKIKRGTKFSVTLDHDCPGCCREPSKKTVNFVV